MTSPQDTLFTRARSSGRCPPSLLSEEDLAGGDGFAELAVRLLDGDVTAGLALRSDLGVVEEFEQALKTAKGLESVQGGMTSDAKSGILSQRRCILLGMVGSTPSTNEPLKRILTNGFLIVVKSWLDEILNSTVGGVDLLLHMLTSISMLPVTKEMVTTSKLGKAVASVEKHKICIGGKNEAAIKDRIAKVKEEWSASVKALKKSGANSNGSGPKRQLETSIAKDDTPAKKARSETQDAPKKSSFSLSSFSKKVSGNASKAPVDKTPRQDQSASSAAEPARVKAQEREVNMKEAPASLESNVQPEKTVKELPKEVRHIQWADQVGGTLEVSHEVEAAESEQTQPDKPGDKTKIGLGSWSDRRKRDRMREKELLARARKSKLIDDTDDGGLDTMAMMVVAWHTPRPLPPDAENPPLQVDSKEKVTQTARMVSVPPASYSSEGDVPGNPSPLTDIEQALELASQSSSSPAVIPFTPPQQEEIAPPPAPAELPGQQQSIVGAPYGTIGATLEMVQSMGLPLFLVGSNVQALQTLAASPSLLQTFVDANGMFDQVRLTNLVRTLTQNLAPTQPGVQTLGAPPPPASQYGNTAQVSMYQPPAQATGYGTYGPSQGLQHTGAGGGYRGNNGGSEGNLHVSGYGPATSQADIIALFSPYVQVDEVVQKGTFSFVNTSDPAGAARAREILNGALLGGMPVRINVATRKAKDPYQSSAPRPARSEPPPLPRNVLGQVEYDQVRDDRGNAATKNLFVAGYGSGTSEQQLREAFGPHCTVTGIIMKNSFSFVNTSDKVAAIHAREALIGAVVNGGCLRINFAKETGRLGTSFDTTYGHGPGPGSGSRYGR